MDCGDDGGRSLDVEVPSIIMVMLVLAWKFRCGMVEEEEKCGLVGEVLGFWEQSEAMAKMAWFWRGSSFVGW